MIKREPLAGQLAHGVLELIRDSDLKAGDALPPVRTLAAQFGVTVPTIREALRGLQATNSITMRHGSGVYVAPGISLSLIPNPNGVPMTEARAIKLIEARLAIEPDIAALAALHRTDSDLLALRESCTNAQSDHSEEVERSFHSDLARSSNNFVLSETIDAVLHVYRDEQQSVRVIIEDTEREHLRHTQIVDAVAAGNPDDARRYTQLHLQEILAEVRQRFDQ